MEIMVNGKACTLKEGATVTDALKALGAVPIYTAVEVDGRLVPKEDWDAMALKKDMRLEVVSLLAAAEKTAVLTPWNTSDPVAGAIYSALCERHGKKVQGKTGRWLCHHLRSRWPWLQYRRESCPQSG